jgi:hypothetical protein
MSGKWNPVLLSTGHHPRCGPIRWLTVSRFYAALYQTGRSAPFLARGVGSNGGFEAVIPGRWSSAFGRLVPVGIICRRLQLHRIEAPLAGYLAILCS